MLKMIDFTTDQGNYIMLYDSEMITDEQALVECNVIGDAQELAGSESISNKRSNPDLSPYYVIIEKTKQPILDCIREQGYYQGYNARVEAEEYIYDF